MFPKEKHQKNMMHADIAMNFNATNVLQAKEQYDTKIKKNNVIIRGRQEDEQEHALSLAKNIAISFEDHFAMQDVTKYVPHVPYRATIMDI